MRRVLSGWSVASRAAERAHGCSSRRLASASTCWVLRIARERSRRWKQREQRSWRSHDPPPRDRDGREHRRCRHADRVGAHQADRDDQPRAVGAGGARGDPVPSPHAQPAPAHRGPDRTSGQARAHPDRAVRSRVAGDRVHSRSLAAGADPPERAHPAARRARGSAGAPARVRAELPATLDGWSSLLDEMEAS